MSATQETSQSRDFFAARAESRVQVVKQRRFQRCRAQTRTSRAERSTARKAGACAEPEARAASEQAAGAGAKQAAGAATEPEVGATAKQAVGAAPEQAAGAPAEQAAGAAAAPEAAG